MLRSLLTGLPKEKELCISERPIANAGLCINHHDQERDANEMKTDPKSPLHSMVEQDTISKYNITEVNIKEEVNQEENHDIHVNTHEKAQMKSKNPLSSITNEVIESQINKVHTEIKKKHKGPCEYVDFDDKMGISKQDYSRVHHILQDNKVSGENVTKIQIKQEVCNEEVNEDIQPNGNGHLQIKSEHAQSKATDDKTEYQNMDVNYEVMANYNGEIENHTTDFANENEESNLVPEIKVSRVYDHVLEISPLKCNHFDGYQSLSEHDVSERPIANAGLCINHHDQERDANEMKTDPKSPLHSMVEQDTISKYNITEVNIKEEVNQEENHDIHVNTHEKAQMKSKNPLSSITNEVIESQINKVHTEIKKKHKGPCEYVDFDDKMGISKQDYSRVHHILQDNKVSGENVTKIQIKQEVCNEEVNEDIQPNGNGHLQIKSEHAQSKATDDKTEYQNMDVNYEVMANYNGEIENHTTDFANENEESNLVPEIKVSRVYDHVLEISPLKCNHFDGYQSLSEHDETTSKTTTPESVKLKKNIRVKTSAERSREYRARKKARQSAPMEESNSSIKIETLEENSQSDNSQDSDNSSPKKRKTPADYSREYRARKKALKELQKQTQDSENSNSQMKPKTSAERSREYRARKKVYVDLEKPIPIAPSIEMVEIRTQHSILPDVDSNTIILYDQTANINTTEEFSDSKTGHHDMLHHIHNYISNKFSEDITNTNKQRENYNTGVKIDIEINPYEHLQVKTNDTNDSINERDESKPLVPKISINNTYDNIIEIKQEIPCEFNIDDDYNTESNATNTDTSEKEKSELFLSERILNNTFDQILEIKQEVPVEFSDIDDNQSIEGDPLNNDALQEGFRIKCEENGQSNLLCAEMMKPVNHLHDRQITDSSRGSNKGPKTSAERVREFRARKALIRQQMKQLQSKEGPSEEVKRIEKRVRSAEATRRWREKKRAICGYSKKEAKTAAQRMREYRQRKKIESIIYL